MSNEQYCPMDININKYREKVFDSEILKFKSIDIPNFPNYKNKLWNMCSKVCINIPLFCTL